MKLERAIDIVMIALKLKYHQDLEGYEEALKLLIKAGESECTGRRLGLHYDARRLPGETP